MSREEAKKFYDRLGVKQDWQRFYEDHAVIELLEHANFESAQSVFEFGCGTGRLAEILLERYLPPDAQYTGIDLSSTMVDLAAHRIAKYRKRARVILSSGEPGFDAGPDVFDRFISAYVLDLLSVDDITVVVAEAHRILKPSGLLGLVSLTHGYTFMSRLVEKIWTGFYRLRPSFVGGCRPVELQQYLRPLAWRMRYVNKISRFGIASETLIAEKAT